MAFLAAAVESVRDQTSPEWRLHVVVAPETPAAVSEIVTAAGDPRIAVVVRKGQGLGAALNTGMRRADTPFVCVALSDDLLEPRAIEVLQRNIRLFPRVDRPDRPPPRAHQRGIASSPLGVGRPAAVSRRP